MCLPAICISSLVEYLFIYCPYFFALIFFTFEFWVFCIYPREESFVRYGMCISSPFCTLLSILLTESFVEQKFFNTEDTSHFYNFCFRPPYTFKELRVEKFSIPFTRVFPIFVLIFHYRSTKFSSGTSSLPLKAHR